MESRYLSINNAAKILGVTPLTLRNWDKKGTLSAYRNPINNYRVYRMDQIELLLRRLENSKNKREGRKIDISMVWYFLGEQDSNQDQLSGANSMNIRGVRSDAYLEVRERRATKKIHWIRPPVGKSKNGRFLRCFSLTYLFRYAFVVTPLNHLIFWLLNLILVRILLSLLDFISLIC